MLPNAACFLTVDAGCAGKMPAMTHDWLLVETLGSEPAVVAYGRSTKNLVPISAYLRRNPNLMAIQTAIGETVRAGLPLSSITPKHDRVIRTEVVQMTDGRIHGVHLWVGPPDIEPPVRELPGPLKWDLTHGIATDTRESLAIRGKDPSTDTEHGRAFAEDLPAREFNPVEASVLSAAKRAEAGRGFCSTWDLVDYRDNPITVGFVGRIVSESEGGEPDSLICRAMNWRSERTETTISAADLGQPLLAGAAEPGVYRALVDLRTWKLLKWLDEPCPFYDWHPQEGGESFTHPEDGPAIERMARDFERGMPASHVLRLRAVGGGWNPVNVTAQVVELERGKHAGLLSMRLPTDDELAAAADSEPAKKGLSGKLRARKAAKSGA
jgi:hypothetical protein